MIEGFIDLQVNGAAGIDFTNAMLTEQDIGHVAAMLCSQGFARFCPTMITTSMEVYAHCFPLLARIIDADGQARNLGIHLEGPFINPAEGPRGVHPHGFVEVPSIAMFEQLREWAEDRIAILTLAPEVPGAIELIKHIASETRTIVSIGHTDAGADDIRRAVDAGAGLATHVGNGIRDQINRHKNALWPIHADDRLSGMFITDGFHLPSDMIQVCLRAKTHKRFIVTSDMVHVAGLAPGEYDFHGSAVILEENGYLHRREAAQLAGSARDMLNCMNYLASLKYLAEEELYDVGCHNALRIFGFDKTESSRAKQPRLSFDADTFHVASGDACR